MAKVAKVWDGSNWVELASKVFELHGTPFNIPNTLVERSASGSFQIGSVDFDTASPVSSAIGRITWDDGAGTVILGLKGGNLNLPIGQQEDALCYNGTGSALARGQVVRIIGAQGQRPRIDLAAAINDANSSKTFGIVAEPIVDGAEGFVTTFGIVNNINTAAFTEGASLWLSPSAGGIVSTMPIQPYHNVFLGYCLKSHASSGRIFVKIQNGYEIEELHDVLIQTASNNHILSYNSASSLWMNKDLQAAIKEVDGPSSGIDSDLLDGQHGLYYQDAAGASATYLKQSDAASAYIRVTSSAAIVSGYIPVSSSYAYLTRSDAENTYIPITSSGAYLTETEAESLYIPISASFRTFDADKLDGFDSSYFINTSSATQEKLGNITFHGTVNIEDLVITGSAITISTTNLALTDSLIQLAHEQYNTDAVDIGIVGSYGDGTTSSAGHYHASFARDASQNKWKLLSNGPAPVNNVIDYSDPSVEYGVLQVGAVEVSSSAKVNNLNADLLDDQTGSYYLDWTNTTNKPDPIIGVELTGPITGAASVTLTDLGNGQISITTSGGGAKYQSASPISPSIGDIWIDNDNDIPGVNLNDYALKNSPHFYGITSFSDGQTIDGQIFVASSVFYIKAGNSNIDPSGIIVLARHSTTDQFIDQFNVYANTSNFKGYITSLDPVSSSHVATKNYVDSVPHPFLLGGM